MFPDTNYDFICSVISLHHIPPQFQRRYIRDFLRVLKPGGVAYFQTIHAHGWRRLVPNFFADWVRKRRSHGEPIIPLYGLSDAEIRRIITSNNGKVEKHECMNYGGWESRYFSDTFVVRKLESSNR
jgi:SAM-dependent methyltransferase